MNYVNHLGEAVSLAAIALKHKPPPKATADALKRVDCRDDAKQSDGFVVLGYAPEVWAEIPKLHTEAVTAFEAEPTKTKSPGTLAEFTTNWMRRNRPKRARSKPYEIAESAELCAELMRKAGWMHVRVDELMRG